MQACWIFWTHNFDPNMTTLLAMLFLLHTFDNFCQFTENPAKFAQNLLKNNADLGKVLKSDS